MTIDERIEHRLEASGHDLLTDEGAQLFQETLERVLEQERKKAQQMPPRRTERINGIML